MSDQHKVSIDRPHAPYGKHVDVIVRLPEIQGAQKLRIGEDGEILTEDINVKGGYIFPVSPSQR